TTAALTTVARASLTAAAATRATGLRGRWLGRFVGGNGVLAQAEAERNQGQRGEAMSHGQSPQVFRVIRSRPGWMAATGPAGRAPMRWMLRRNDVICRRSANIFAA